MKTKEAIESVENAYGAREELYASNARISKKIVEDQANVITLLQQGEKYKQMWNEFRFHYGEVPIGEYVDIATQMNNFEGKKHPKEVK